MAALRIGGLFSQQKIELGVPFSPANTSTMFQRILPRTIRLYSTVAPSLEVDLRAALKLSMKARDSFRTTVIKVSKTPVHLPHLNYY